MNNKKEQEREELHKTIWKIANELRGSVDGWDFKQYVLGLLFYRFISENIEHYVNENQRTAEMENWEEDAIKYNIESHILKSEEDSQKLMKLAHKISRENDATVIIDVPGNITEPYLAPIFINADFIVCPFVYQALALDSTSTFVKVILKLKKLKPDMHTKLLFVPNMVDKKFGTVDELDNFRQNADAVFEKIGVLTPRVYDRAELKRISTILYTPKQKHELNACFATLDSNIFK